MRTTKTSAYSDHCLYSSVATTNPVLRFLDRDVLILDIHLNLQNGF